MDPVIKQDSVKLYEPMDVMMQYTYHVQPAGPNEHILLKSKIIESFDTRFSSFEKGKTLSLLGTRVIEEVVFNKNVSIRLTHSQGIMSASLVIDYPENKGSAVSHFVTYKRKLCKCITDCGFNPSYKDGWILKPVD